MSFCSTESVPFPDVLTTGGPPRLVHARAEGAAARADPAAASRNEAEMRSVRARRRLSAGITREEDFASTAQYLRPGAEHSWSDQKYERAYEMAYFRVISQSDSVVQSALPAS